MVICNVRDWKFIFFNYFVLFRYNMDRDVDIAECMPFE